MKLSFKKIEIILIALLYLSALFIWTLPMRSTKMPFGDVDASSHFTIGDYMASYDKSILKIPYPVTFRYWGQNAFFPDYLWYPPQYWTNVAISQVIGGERVLPVFLLVAILCSIIILSSYLLIRSLYGFWAAFLSSFLLIFSIRDYMIYLFGQWPQSLSFAFTPLVLYCFYKYHQSYKENKTKPAYIYLMALFLSSQFFFHPQGMIASAGTLILYNLILLIKNKKIPFNYKHLIISVVLFAAVSSVFAPLNIGEFFSSLVEKQSEAQGSALQFDKLFKWYQGIKGDPGLPDFYFTYNESHGSLLENIKNTWRAWWTLPFLLIGVFILFYRRKEEDYLLLSWLVAFYFLSRMIVWGFGSRDIRMFAYEAHIFYPIIAIGLLSLSSLPRQEIFRKYLKAGLIAVFFFFAIYVNGVSAYEVLKSQQNTIYRINPYQYEAAEWVKNNLPENADIYDFGTIGFQNYAAKVKWMLVLSQRHFIVGNDQLNMTNYVFIDYSDAALAKNQNYFNSIKEYEQQQFQNFTPIYNKDNLIKVYKVGIKK